MEALIHIYLDRYFKIKELKDLPIHRDLGNHHVITCDEYSSFFNKNFPRVISLRSVTNELSLVYGITQEEGVKYIEGWAYKLNSNISLEAYKNNGPHSEGYNTTGAGYVYSPYIPLQMTPLDEFKPRKSIMSRYSERVVNPSFYGTINIPTP